MRTADLDFDSEINLVSLVLLKDPRPAHFRFRERERQGFQAPATQSPGEGLRYHCYNEVNDKNIIFSAGKIITAIHKVAYCNNINSDNNNSNNMIII